MDTGSLTSPAPEIRGPQDVPRLRDHLADLWQPGRIFWRMSEHQHLRMREANQVRAYTNWERQILNQANLWWVSSEMVDLLEAAARTVPDDVRIEDLPNIEGSGFAVFERSALGHSVEGTNLNIDAVAWGPAHLPADIPSPLLRRRWPDGAPAMAVSSYSCFDLDAGLTGDDLTRAAPLLAEEFDLGDVQWNREPEEQEETAAEHDARHGGSSHTIVLHGGVWGPLGRSDWVIGERVDSTEWVEELERTTAPVRSMITHMEGMESHVVEADLDAVRTSYVEDRKLLVAFWTLVHQGGIAETTISHPARPLVRRAQREDRSRPEVRIVRLRRPERSEPGEGEAEHREWSCHWVVNGHWRNQAYGPKRSKRRLRWIDPYVKGDLDKPLHQPTTVRAWVR